MARGDQSVVFDTPVFEDPPETSRTRAEQPSKWRDIAELLKDSPSSWAQVFTSQVEDTAKQTASGIRNGTRIGFSPKGTFEARYGAAADPGQYGVWARYVGPGSAEADELESAEAQESAV